MLCYLNRYLKMSNITFKLFCYCYCCKTYANMKSVSKVCTNHSSSIKKSYILLDVMLQKLQVLLNSEMNGVLKCFN